MIPADNNTFNNNLELSISDDCNSEYELYDGTLIIPVMGDSTQKPVIVRLHPPYTMRTSRFEYARSKVPPCIPAPADTFEGDHYLGGSIRVAAPVANLHKELVFRVKGTYNFLVNNDIRMNGKIRFDAHEYESFVDYMGLINPPDGDTWTDRYYDLNLLASARILG